MPYPPSHRPPNGTFATRPNRPPPLRRARAATWALLLGAALLAGCGEDTAGDGFDPTALYASEGGAYQLQGVRNPDPPRKGLNSFELALTNAAGDPITDASVRIEPWMPAHGHGTTVIDTPPTGDGSYATEELYFNMTGRWEVRVLVDGPSGEDRLVLHFEVK